MRFRPTGCIDRAAGAGQHPPSPHARSRSEREISMQRALTLLALGAGASLLASLPAFAQSGPEVTLTRFECGTPPAPTEVNARISDTYAYPGLKVQFVYSCYLIKHGDDYM